MKKLASVFTALIICLTVFSVIPSDNKVNAEADTTDAPSSTAESKGYVIDFEGAQGAFYGEDNTNRIALSDTVDITAAENHGNVMGFKKLMVYRDDNYVKNPSNGAVKWNTIYYPTAFRLPTADGSGTLYLEKYEKYLVSFEMKKNADVSDTYFSGITAALVFAESYGVGVDTGNIRDWVNNGQTATLATVGLSADSDWVKYTAYITVPVSGYAAFMLYGTNFANSCDIVVDNIILTPISRLAGRVDFENAQSTFYESDSNRICYADAADIAGTDTHGNVMHFTDLKIYRTDAWVDNTDLGSVKWNTIYYPSAVRLPAADGSETLYLEAGSQYTVTFDMKKNAEIDGEYFSEFKAALVFAESYAIGIDTGNIRDWVENNQTATLAVIDLKADSDWVTYSTTVTVPVSGYAAFMLYGTNYASPCDIYVDNIIIEEFDSVMLNRDGDVNGDGKTDIKDLVRIKKMAAGASEKMPFADIDFDSVIAGAGDITRIKKLLFGTGSIVPYTKGERSLVWNEEFEHSNSFAASFIHTHSMDHTDASEDYTVEYSNWEHQSVENGSLNLSIGKTETGYSVGETISTYGTMYYKYGYLEMRAMIPYSLGAWPGCWLLGNTPYHDGTAEWFAEVDVFEVFSNVNTLAANIHKHGGQNQGYGEQLGVFNKSVKRTYTFENYENLSNEYHIYGFEWNDTQMKFYVDGECFCTFNYSDFDQSKYYKGTEYFNDFMYVQMTNEIHPESLTGTETVDADYCIDWIRLYQNKENGEEIIY